eukprot:CAMPEP_0198323976 /NCGR_PEP_ID=MMETSP1450-20131203/12077_1 /TAXON_ID=753684 ORGANISM="Madagascaria erythrocladiodes, Strain CCMP3234" /NCGR_SAMPLE_ID=MMETSP1450 /ASSEMBLY_ACC=CAM_ASM_001115 /LENGTH=56 /DNA_ID=CAMNT_0044027727 /DNA_START=44 /DNA_END=210 /DNA_ORIENTATION=+
MPAALVQHVSADGFNRDSHTLVLPSAVDPSRSFVVGSHATLALTTQPVEDLAIDWS